MGLGALVVGLALPFGARQAEAAPVVTTCPISLGGNPLGITQGPDGALWIAEGADIARVTSDCSARSTYQPPNASNFRDITAGPDGNLWFTDQSGCNGVPAKIGRITPSGSVTMFDLPGANFGANGIVTGPDGALWFTLSNCNTLTASIGRITTGGRMTFFPVVGELADLAFGPDGAVWFTEWTRGRIGRMSTTTGRLQEFPLPASNREPFRIVAGPDGAMWFTEASPAAIARIDECGGVTEHPLPNANSYPDAITIGDDGLFYVAEWDTDAVTAVDLSGHMTEFSLGGDANSRPGGITVAADHRIWVTSAQASRLSWFTASGPGYGAPPAPTPCPTPPLLPSLPPLPTVSFLPLPTPPALQPTPSLPAVSTPASLAPAIGALPGPTDTPPPLIPLHDAGTVSNRVSGWSPAPSIAFALAFLALAAGGQRRWRRHRRRRRASG
jgi:virginiamycin B lyase